MKKLILFLGFTVAVMAQPYSLGVSYGITSAVGACTVRSTLTWNYTTGILYACNAGTQAVVATAGGAGTVTSVGQTFTGGLISVAGSPVTTSGTLALSVAGTSGGVPYFSGATTWASSGALTANLPVIGGGAGAAPTVGTRSGNTTAYVTTTGVQTNGDCVKIDASGNHIANGSACGGGSGTVTSIGTTSPITGGTITTTGTIACATCVTSAAALTSDLPVIGAGSQATAVGTRSGNTTAYVTTTGTQTSGDCVKIDASGNHIANGSACGSGGGGLVLIEQHTASASSSLDFTTCISSTYDVYKFSGVGLIPSTSTADLRIEVGTGGGPTWDTGNNYEWAMQGLTTAGGGSNDSGFTGIARIFASMGVTAGWAGSFDINLFNPQSTALRKTFSGVIQFVNSSPLSIMGQFGMQWTTTATAATGVRFIPSTGTITSGTIRCYGLEK